MSRVAVLSSLVAFLMASCARGVPFLQPAGGCVTCHAGHRAELGSCVSCHRGDPLAVREELAHAELLHGRAAAHGLPDQAAAGEGLKLVQALACRRCHAIGGRGNRLAASLDRVVWNRDQEALAQSIREPVENMPRFGLSASQMQAVTAALLRGGERRTGVSSYRVHFARQSADASSQFEEHCGACHRALLARGPSGRGNAGPNLSGLFTRDYPPAAASGVPWTPASLREWLRHPASVRRAATMRPIPLDEPSWRALQQELTE